jgi:hypothetical protein
METRVFCHFLGLFAREFFADVFDTKSAPN